MNYLSVLFESEPQNIYNPGSSIKKWEEMAEYVEEVGAEPDVGHLGLKKEKKEQGTSKPRGPRTISIARARFRLSDASKTRHCVYTVGKWTGRGRSEGARGWQDSVVDACST